MLETRQIVPSYAIDLALQAPMEVAFPLAPAEGLLLVDVGMGRTRENVEVCFITSYHPISVYLYLSSALSR
jgi:hypothetical protein